jgi:hypothetical protein
MLFSIERTKVGRLEPPPPPCTLCYTSTGAGIRYNTYRIRGYALCQKKSTKMVYPYPCIRRVSDTDTIRHPLEFPCNIGCTYSVASFDLLCALPSYTSRELEICIVIRHHEEGKLKEPCNIHE